MKKEAQLTEAARMLAQLTGLDVRRNAQKQSQNELDGINNWSIKVKHQANATRETMAIWWAECVRQALDAGLYPLLVYRLHGQSEWTCVWSAALLNAALNSNIDQLDRALFTAPAMWWEFSKGSININLNEGASNGHQ